MVSFHVPWTQIGLLAVGFVAGTSHSNFLDTIEHRSAKQADTHAHGLAMRKDAHAKSASTIQSLMQRSVKKGPSSGLEGALQRMKEQPYLVKKIDQEGPTWREARDNVIAYNSRKTSSNYIPPYPVDQTMIRPPDANGNAYDKPVWANNQQLPTSAAGAAAAAAASAAAAVAPPGTAASTTASSAP